MFEENLLDAFRHKVIYTVKKDIKYFMKDTIWRPIIIAQSKEDLLNIMGNHNSVIKNPINFQWPPISE